jgi:protease-4
MVTQRSKKWTIWILFGLIIGCLILSVFQNTSHSSLNKSPFLGSKTIAVLPIYEALSISKSDPLGGGTSADDIVHYLEALSENDQIKALVIRINSPGGTVAASQEIYQAILSFKAKTKVPVIVSIGDIGASGAFWIAMAGDTIFANAGSLVGSIGVIMSTMDLTEVPKRYGVGMNTYKSVTHKDILSSWRKASPTEKEIIQTMLEDIQLQFMHTVAKGRKMTLEEVKTVADGRIFTGKQAQKAKLIDKIGTLDDAIQFAAKQAHIEGKPDIVMPEGNSLSNLLNIWRSDSQAEFRGVIR